MAASLAQRYGPLAGVRTKTRKPGRRGGVEYAAGLLAMPLGKRILHAPRGVGRAAHLSLSHAGAYMHADTEIRPRKSAEGARASPAPELPRRAQGILGIWAVRRSSCIRPPLVFESEVFSVDLRLDRPVVAPASYRLRLDLASLAAVSGASELPKNLLPRTTRAFPSVI
ncbi:hypothetical protein SLA_6064 [Streptomyces laurentii]|uniref:Uncharacterized protein n=1 Tax=Streptomyces laurentii TaxID=39478 RepID=A0A160P7V9_STRLU|nr:hypothetical protein SLA_6064 [Streptomyces laurentii]